MQLDLINDIKTCISIAYSLAYSLSSETNTRTLRLILCESESEILKT